jgi:hypothetical protein
MFRNSMAKGIRMAIPIPQNPNLIRKNKDERGRFTPGNIANPGGRPKLPEELRLMCQGNAEVAIGVAVELLMQTEQPGNVRLKAAEVILDRGYGKAPQSITIDVATATRDITEFLLGWFARHSVNGMITVEESVARAEVSSGLLGIVGQAPAVIVVAEGE